MAMSAEHKLKFAALHRKRRCLHMTDKFSSGTIHPKTQNNEHMHLIL